MHTNLRNKGIRFSAERLRFCHPQKLQHHLHPDQFRYQNWEIHHKDNYNLLQSQELRQKQKEFNAVTRSLSEGLVLMNSSGTVLSIKPILRGDETGHIVSCGKVRGLKRAYAELANYFDTRALDKSESIGIAHADNAEGAEALLALLRDKGFTGECLSVVYEPVTGAHVGPGTVALFFYGTEK